MDTFIGYTKGAQGYHKVGFIVNTKITFKDYSKNDVSFSTYNTSFFVKGNLVKIFLGELDKFFCKKMLKEGTVMLMPNKGINCHKGHFLPLSILTKLPFSSLKVEELKPKFKVYKNSDSLGKCVRAPSVGETKHYVCFVEDMIDFATSLLARNVAFWITENVNMSNKNVLVGQVKGMYRGKVTQFISCHQSLFPYLLYYYHIVPKVQVHKANILGPKSKAKINHNVAIFNLYTPA
uniref:Polygalacturonase non-catalytic subunit JP630 family n=1 Tax=Cajanus cajan TaxID=3821 RepID=A0A151SJB5_CAJCA|nr:putative polygalacturonase non-catalytic subunit JP630 family [Cajanus cajan]